MLGFGKFSPSLNAFKIKKPLLNKFGAAGLNGKIVLSKCYFRLTRVAVLGHKIAGVTSQHYVIYLALSSGAKSNHFADISKMVGD